MTSAFAYILMVHMLGSTQQPYWLPADQPVVVYSDVGDCTKRAAQYMHLMPDFVFGCPMAKVR